MSSGGARVSIPNSVRKTIQSIKEITGNHSEDEIYAMLKDCSMDPNETAQKLLNDSFHEIKRKRDGRKENLSNIEPAESRWRPGMQGRRSRGGRGNHSSHYSSNDAGGGGNSALGKENGINQVLEKDVGLSSLPTSQETKNKDITPATSSCTVVTNGPAAVAPGSTGVVNAAHFSSGSLVKQSEECSAVESKLGASPPLPLPLNVKENPIIEFGTLHTHGQLTSSSSNSSAAGVQAPLPGVYFSASDPVLVPSHDSRLPGAVGAIKREVGSQRTPVEQISLVPSEGKTTTGQDITMHGKMPSKSTGVGNNQLSDSIQPVSTHGRSSVTRPLSNYNNRSQQVIGSQEDIMESSSSSKFRLNPRICYCGRTAAIYITRTNVNENQRRVFCVCPSRDEKGAQQSCRYFHFVDEEDEDVTSMDCSIQPVTAEEVDDIKERLKTMDKLIKLALVIALVSFVKCFL